MIKKLTFPIATNALAFLLTGCGQGVVTEAFEAERDGRIISNKLMTEMYPSTFRKGEPPYLERDFEAGADFICDEIKMKRKRDICAEADINWRR